MSRGRHAAPKTHGPAPKAARTALARTGAFTVGVGLTWTLVSAVAGQGYLDAFAAGSQTAAGATVGAAAQPAAEKAFTAKQVRRVTELNRAYDCSPEGLAPGVAPARAVVRVDDRIRLATFDEGWAMHLGEAPGTLVSVCAK